MTAKQVRAKFERTSFGTVHAKAARRSVSTAVANKIVARSGVTERSSGRQTTRRGG